MSASSPQPKNFIPPRGGWDTIEGIAPRATWMNPVKLQESQWCDKAGKIILGVNDDGETVAYSDDRHMITIAGSRAGKTQTMLVPNLRRYTGSMVVIDPKGELAEETAVQRAAMGQKVYILDPFRIVQKRKKLRTLIDAHPNLDLTDQTSNFNPLQELTTIEPEYLLGEVATLAESLIIPNEHEPHWTNSASNLIQAVVLYLLSGQEKFPATLLMIVRFFRSIEIQEEIYAEMKASKAYDGFLRDVAVTNIRRITADSTEYGSIISTAYAQIASLADMGAALGHSDFWLGSLKTCPTLKTSPTTIYLVLPASKMGTHSKWLRMFITLALSALERDETKPEHPVLFVLEEFAALQYMRPIERAAGYMAGFGVKLWAVLQDLQQLKSQYRDSWQTFLGNAGMLQVFGLNDGTTEEFISKRLGTTQYEDDEPVHHRSFHSRDLINPPVRRLGRLLEPHEVRLSFSKETHQQIILFPHLEPIALTRLPYDY